MVPRSILAVAVLTIPGAALGQNVVEVQVAPPSVTIKVGERTGLLATAFDRIGNVIPTVRLVWSSNDLRVAKVDNNGTVTGVGPGNAIIEARVGSRKGQSIVTVTGTAPPSQPVTPQPHPQTPPPGGDVTAPAVDALATQPPGIGPAAGLRIEPPAIYLLPSENTRAAPRALREDGSPAAPVRVTWKSLREDIASVDQNGVVVALAPGQGTIQMTGPGGLTATAPVVVQQSDIGILEAGPIGLSPGDLDTLHVVVPAQTNRAVNPLALQWTSTDPNVARVSLSGVVTAVGPGKAILTVAGFLQTKSVAVAVHKAVEFLVARPKSQGEIPVPVTGTAKFEAQALASDNTPVPDAPLRWSVADTSIAGFDPATGALTGKKLGKTQLVVRAPGQGLSITWTVNVIAGAVKLSATRLGLYANRRAVIRASFADDAGAVIGPASGTAWASDNPQVATVGDDGTVSAVGYGHARITATAPGGKSATTDVFVQGEIVLASSRSGRFQLYAAERANIAQLRKIADDTASALDPAFSADGSRVAFVSTRDGNPEIYVMNADGTEATRLTKDPRVDGRPVFMPDGQSLVLHSDRTGHNQIYVIGLDGANPKQLTQEPATNFQSSVSADGETIAFVSTREGNYDVWLMSKDGSNQRSFSKTPQQKETDPHFLRDGSLVYLVERREGNRAVTQVMKADLATGRTAPLSGTDLTITGVSVSPAGDLLGLTVGVLSQGDRGNPIYKVYIQPIGAGAPVPMPTTGAEQMVTPTFMP